MHLDKDCVEMTKHTSLAIALTATTFLCTPAVASSLTPTLDALKSEAGSVLPSVNQTYNLSELSGDLPTGAVKVEIGGKDYYFMPSGDNAGLLMMPLIVACTLIILFCFNVSDYLIEIFSDCDCCDIP